MSLKSSISKNVIKNSLKSIKVITFIGVSSLLFTQFIVASELSTITKVPVAYKVSELSSLVNRQVPADYTKANYKAIYSIHTRSKTPNSKDLSLQEAAEIAAQEIFKLSGEKLDNKTLEVGYSPQITTQYRSKWFVDVAITPSYGFVVAIDGCTGELDRIQCAGGPDIDENFDPDSPSTRKLINERLDPNIKQIKANLDASFVKAKNLITKKGYLSEPIKSITYEYTFCDAFAVVDHSFIVTTNSNKVYHFYLSQDLTQMRGYFPE